MSKKLILLPAFSSPNVYRGPPTPTTDPPTAADCNTEAEARAGVGTAARMTRVRAAVKNAFTEPPSTGLVLDDDRNVEFAH